MNQHAKSDCAAVLRQCERVFDPAHSPIYMEAGEGGHLLPRAAEPGEIPAGFPKNLIEVRELAGKGYSAMLSLSLPQEYLTHPDLEAQAARCGELSPEECAQFLLFAFRLTLRFGQEMFFDLWRQGALKTAAARLRQHLETGH